MEPVPATLVSDPDSLLKEGSTPGAFWIAESGTYIRLQCPCGCGTHMRLPLYPEGTPHPPVAAWSWDGNRTHPTLLPSIRDLSGCRFHGHLTSGVWTFQPDSGVEEPK